MVLCPNRFDTNLRLAPESEGGPQIDIAKSGMPSTVDRLKLEQESTVILL